MTTTDPTITIAGLRARINSLRSAVQHGNRTAAERMTMFVEASSNADRLTAERDALAAQLAKVRAELVQLGGADLARDAAEDRAARLDADLAKVRAELAAAIKADLASERSHLAACRTRIAGLEQAADEQSSEVARLTAQLDAAQAAGWETVKAKNQRAISAEAEVARLTNERSEWIHAAVSIGEHVDHLGPVAIGAGETNPREWIHYAHGLAGRVKARIGALTARVAELEARPVLTEERLRGALFACADGASDAEVRAILAALGPVTLPAQDRAEELVSAWRGICTDSATCDLDPAERMRRALASLGAPPTSPPAARPVFAWVSVEELVVQYLMACDPGLDPGVARSMVSGPRRAGVAAVLTRLKTTLVAPVDLAAIERAVKAYHNASGEHAVPADALGTGQWRAAVLAMTDAFLAAGIPVTPEVDK